MVRAQPMLFFAVDLIPDDFITTLADVRPDPDIFAINVFTSFQRVIQHSLYLVSMPMHAHRLYGIWNISRRPILMTTIIELGKEELHPNKISMAYLCFPPRPIYSPKPFMHYILYLLDTFATVGYEAVCCQLHHTKYHCNSQITLWKKMQTCKGRLIIAYNSTNP